MSDPLHGFLGYQIGRAYAAYRRLVEVELAQAGLAELLTPGMGPVLYHLFEHEGCTASTIVQRLGLDKATVTNLLNAMERRGLIAREQVPGDRRCRRLCLTAEGRALAAPCRQLLVRIESRLRANVADPEAFIADLRQLGT